MSEVTISEKRAKLGELLAWFESDGFELEKAAAKFDEATRLADEIEHELIELKNNINVLKKRFDQE